MKPSFQKYNSMIDNTLINQIKFDFFLVKARKLIYEKALDPFLTSTGYFILTTSVSLYILNRLFEEAQSQYSTFAFCGAYLAVMLPFLFFYRFSFKKKMSLINNDDEIKSILQNFQKFLSTDANFYHTINAFHSLQENMVNKSEEKKFNKSLDSLMTNFNNNSLKFEDILFFEKHHQTISVLGGAFEIDKDAMAKNFNFMNMNC